MTPQAHSAHDQKYSPDRVLNRMKRDMLISAPMYQDMPMKAAMVMDMGRLSLMLEISVMVPNVFVKSQ